jgi:hypothetical protein
MGGDNATAKDLHKLGYDLALRSLGQQEGALNELRARTGTLLAASSIVASFLGSEAISRAGFGFLGTLALTAFVVSIAGCIYVLLPKSQLVFALSGTVLLEQTFSESGGVSEAHRRLAYWIQEFWNSNQTVLERLFTSYRLAAFALLAEVLLWGHNSAISFEHGREPDTSSAWPSAARPRSSRDPRRQRWKFEVALSAAESI